MIEMEMQVSLFQLLIMSMKNDFVDLPFCLCHCRAKKKNEKYHLFCSIRRYQIDLILSLRMFKHYQT